MNNTDIQKARKWAKEVSEEYFDYITVDSRAAIKVIQSLPDHIIDAEELQKIYDRYRANEITLHEAFRDTVALTAPPLPTLADMTPEEREACQWMQADVKLYGEGSVTCVIADPRRPGAKVRVWASHGGSDDVEEGRVTPLPDLPKLMWPSLVVSDESEAASVETEESFLRMVMDSIDEEWGIVKPDQQPEHVVKALQTFMEGDSEPTLPCPEDVPEGEPWIVRYEREEWVGVRAKADRVPWHIISMDGLDCRDVEDSEITLMPRLVPETP